jgi:GH43 family beta-xylosidase
MTHSTAATNRLTYQNPVFAKNFPDPFVIKYCGEYWAFGTGVWHDGRVFGILRSRDLVQWQDVGGAMTPLPDDHPCYWAPEVTVDNGRFYLYYSVGNEINMHIRVASAAHPAGPFIDQGTRLTGEPFAIDAHVFVDDDGCRYLFYATDFLDHERVGTGTVMDRLRDPFTLAGQPRPVSRARYDWQIYHPHRAEKGGARWHTLEGSFVLKRKGVYYQMFSGGNWKSPGYGVGYAVTRTLDTPDEWRQVCDGEQTLPILRTLPGQVIGPGHNSVVRGPDNRQLYCVYHRWGNGDGRQLAIDPLDFAGERLLILGPSHTPHSPSPLPAITDFFDGPRLHARWQARGQWQKKNGAVVAAGNSGEKDILACAAPGASFLVEVSARALANGAGYGLSLRDGQADLLQLRLSPAQGGATVRWAGKEQPLALPQDFRFDAYHLLRVEVNGLEVSLCVDDQTICWRGRVMRPPDQIALVADQMAAAFAGFALTVGWQDCFESGVTLAELGWESNSPSDWTLQARQLIFANPDGEDLLHKGPSLAAYDLVVNARLDRSSDQGRYGVSRYGIAPALSAGGAGPLLTIEPAGAGWAAVWQAGGTAQRFPLPASFDPTVYQQFRFRKEHGRLVIHWEQHEIGVMPVTIEPTRIGLYGCRAAAFDMVRVTAIPAQLT